MTTERVSPTTGSATRTTLVATATAALSPAGPPASSRTTRIWAACSTWAPGPRITVQVAPWEAAKNGVFGGVSIRTAV